MKSLFVLFASFIFLLPVSQAQMTSGLFGNEWIDYNQSYYKIKVSRDGLHRLSTQVLQNAGVNISGINPADLQLYHNGEQVPIWVDWAAGQISFYGEQNRGALDAEMHPVPSQILNPEYSLINDTAAYFLTWSPGSHARYNNRSANLSNLPSKEPYFMYESVEVYRNSWDMGRRYFIDNARLSKSSYELGEGYATSINHVHNLSIPTLHVNTSGPNAEVELRLFSVANVQHDVDFLVNGTTYANANFNEDSIGNYVFNVPPTALNSSTATVRVQGATNSDDHRVSYIKLRYPRDFNFDGAASFRFRLPASASRRYLEITNIDATNANQQNIYLYDISNRIRTQCFWDGTRLRVDVPAATQDHEFLLVNEAAPNSLTQVTEVQERNFTNYQNSNSDYIIISHPSLYSDAQGNPVQDYAFFRASTGYQPLIVNIEELYDQFAYGIDYHPLAIRHFLHYAEQNWANAQYAFLIGKGRSYNNTRFSKPSDLLLPVMGHPPSDLLTAARRQSDVPALAIGRLAATTGEQVRIYLNKIQAQYNSYSAPQTLADQGWRKNILHLGGGSNNQEQSIIRSYLNNMRNIAEGANFGGNVYSFFKTSTDPIQAAQSTFLDSLVTTGVSQITFFGHSSPNSFDFQLDIPSNYENTNRYFVLMALGCYGGSIYDNGQQISEQFVFQPDAAASAFIAPVGASTLSALNRISNQYYAHLSGAYHSDGLGKLLQETARSLNNSSTYSTTVQMATQFMILHGDPALTLNTQARPDYYIDQSLISTTPATVTTQLTDFTLNIDAYNLGKGIDTVFYVSVTRRFPDGSEELVARERVDAPHFSERYSIPLPVGGLNALGVNEFTIEVESDRVIEERPLPGAEDNNIVLNYTLRIVSDAIVPIEPYEFAIVPEAPTLRASTGNTFASSQTYRIQIDTTEYFNSPLFQEQQLTQIGGVVEWTPNINYQDSVVYYWRVSPDSVDANTGFQWLGSSFIYLDGSFPGWNQSHFFQYKKDDFQNIVLPESTRNFAYITSLQEITATVGQVFNPLFPELFATYQSGNKYWRCRNCEFNRNGIFLQVYDPATLEIWENPASGGRLGVSNCRNTPTASFLFETQTAAGQAALESAIRDSIPAGYYVSIFSLNDAAPNAWSGSLINTLEEQGAWYLNDWQNRDPGTPYLFFFEKGDSSFAYKTSVLGDNAQSVIDGSFLIPGNWDNGYLSSRLIGPAQDWGSLHWRSSSLSNPQNDFDFLHVYGVTANGNESLLLSNLQAPDSSLQAIDASIYPQLRLEWRNSDVVDKTAPQLDYWRVLYTPVPEAALRPDLFSSLSSDSLQQGEELEVAIALQNISDQDMDSMLVKYQVLESNQPPVYQRLAPLPSGDTLVARASIPTAGLSGNNQLLVEINPDDDQPERFHFNNIGLIGFRVERDRINPLLDVTFDGVHIMNGDIVSGQPEIVVTLKDENPFLGLDDIEDFNILLRHGSFNTPNGERELTAANTDLEFYPAPANRLAEENKAQIIMRPDLIADGNYTLFISAKDKSGNNSGELSYSVDFEVINEAAISNMLNYPNPFSTSTQFVFTLTGRELPDYMKIQIMTVSGKIVREIGMEELGPLRIGINRTDFAWDGTDQFGDRLANGVYLYRVIAKKDGEDYGRHSIERTNQFFNKGWGKMYLMR